MAQQLSQHSRSQIHSWPCYLPPTPPTPSPPSAPPTTPPATPTTTSPPPPPRPSPQPPPASSHSPSTCSSERPFSRLFRSPHRHFLCCQGGKSATDNKLVFVLAARLHEGAIVIFSCKVLRKALVIFYRIWIIHNFFNLFFNSLLVNVI